MCLERNGTRLREGNTVAAAPEQTVSDPNTVSDVCPAAALRPAEGAQHLALVSAQKNKFRVGSQPFAEGWKSEGSGGPGRRERVSQGIEKPVLIL